jgi:8-oxo-dGTP pyrophosphatase MutT (NUDIX family)
MPRQGNDQHFEDETDTLIPAATVVLLRDNESEVEVLMLRKSLKIQFGGMWVFPGGRIDPNDYKEDGDSNVAARYAAARETHEEAGIVTEPEDFVLFAHWTPPLDRQRRFSTWFFAARAESESSVRVDGGEIEEFSWINPAAALSRHERGEIDLVPPTWMTLYYLSRRGSVAAILEHFRSQPRKTYETRIAVRPGGVRVAMWHGDAGYEASDATADGERHRLVMAPDGFSFENSVESY